MAELRPSPLQDPVATHFVESVLLEWNGELAFVPAALESLGQSSYDVMDILAVVSDGVTTSLEKDDAYETLFERFGRIDCGAQLRVTLSYCPHRHDLTVVGLLDL